MKVGNKEGLEIRYSQKEKVEKAKDKWMFESFACAVAEVITIYENVELKCATFWLLREII